MAAEFLKTHGIDLDAEMARIQSSQTSNNPANQPIRSPISLITNVSLPKTTPGSLWDISISNGLISQISPHDQTNSTPSPSPSQRLIEGNTALLTPSLCHPHIHIDKAYLLSHPKYAHLRIQQGDFSEAMELTGQAKSQFERWDLLERGQRIIDESVAAGVTHMRAFVEVDAGVGTKCLDAGIELKLKAEREGRCKVQLCAFAQLPLFSPVSAAGGVKDEDGSVIRALMEDAAGREQVEVVGSTPYVEADRARGKRNVEWMVELSRRCDVHLDFHLDYHLDADTPPMLGHVVKTLRETGWAEQEVASSAAGKERTRKTVVLGHCTRLTLCTPEEWRRVEAEIGDLPISFVGLPTSDLFMMRTAHRKAGTLNVPELIEDYNLNACLGVNNVGNAFTPHGSCDPLTLACSGVGIYQAGTEDDAKVLFECVSTRARRAIGVAVEGEEKRDVSLEVRVGDAADLVLFGAEREEWRTRRSVAEAVYLHDAGRGRKGFLGGVQTT